jgi:hypothetical protein
MERKNCLCINISKETAANANDGQYFLSLPLFLFFSQAPVCFDAMPVSVVVLGLAAGYASGAISLHISLARRRRSTRGPESR